MPRACFPVFAAGVTSLCLASVSLPLRADDPGGRGLEIARGADRANQGFQGEQATMAMEIINAHGDITRRRLKVETLEGSDDGDKAKVVIESPPDVRGTKLLTWNHRQREDDQWLYLPAIKRVRRIGGSSKRSGFVGSEFSYEDLASNEVDRFTYKYLDEPVLDGRPTFRLERYPVDRDSAYSRQVVWLDKQYQNPLRVEYYDRSGVLLKRASFQGYRAHGRWWRPDAVVMENLQTRKKSIIRWEDRRLGLKLAPAGFDSARLED